MKVKVSVIVTSYNYGDYIERCIRSLLAQSYPADNYEIIIVDDRSTDTSQLIVEKYLSLFSNLKYIRNTENVGVAESGNVGIRAALGQFVVRVDADDFVNTNFISSLVSYLEANNGIFSVACDYLKINDDEEVLGRFSAEQYPVSCGIMYRKDLLVKAGLYNKEFRHCEEMELRARLGDKYRIEYLKMPLYRYRIHGKNKTTLVNEFNEHANQIISLYGEKRGLAAKHVVAVIPARGGSKRLKGKNIYLVCGKPMMVWAIEACGKSKYIKDVYVTSDDQEILKIAKENGAKEILRPEELARDHVYKMEAVRHAVEEIISNGSGASPDIVVVLQPNSPEVSSKSLDAAIEKLFCLGKQEIFSVDYDLNQNATFRILTRDAVFQKDLSTNCGVYVTDEKDIHTLEDVNEVEERMKNKLP